MARTIVYIDALNLYYQALKWSAHKWLNVEALANAVLPATCNVTRINYYVADVSGRVDPDAPRRQQALLRALKSTPIVQVHKGNFLSNEIWTGIVQPMDFRPVPLLSFHWPRPIVGLVHKTEEKGSDVNLGVHLVRDGFRGDYDIAAVLTNDTDLKEPIRIVTKELGLPVILLTPVNNPARSLRDLSSDVRHVRPYLGPCQFPTPIILASGQQVHRPKSWAVASPPRVKRKNKALDFAIRHQRPANAAITASAGTGSFFLTEAPWLLLISFSSAMMAATWVACAISFGVLRRFRGY